ncbi:unnamed protein product [Schistosoma curassoni]|uniref:Uncharacterized protein n=1 Tax=Schistosoma curassoni TaxID=6186 RepID=A0A183L1E7_9TREM|nr:unnamed protein product [Schistosoma curassoni]
MIWVVVVQYVIFGKHILLKSMVLYSWLIQVRQRD